jgi:hypothetical protein
MRIVPEPQQFSDGESTSILDRGHLFESVRVIT